MATEHVLYFSPASVAEDGNQKTGSQECNDNQDFASNPPVQWRSNSISTSDIIYLTKALFGDLQYYI